MKNIRHSAVLCAALLSAWTNSLNANIISTFDTGLEGWTVNNTTPVFVPTGGNPGGYMFIDNPETTVSEIIAPAAFLGDLRSYIGGTLSFDGNKLQQLATDYGTYGTITIAGSADTAVLDIVSGQPLNSWTTYSIDLNAATWGKTAAQWDSLLANVTSLRINVEAVFGGEQEGIDNVSLTVVPEPTTLVAGALLLLPFGLQGIRRLRNRKSVA